MLKLSYEDIIRHHSNGTLDSMRLSLGQTWESLTDTIIEETNKLSDKVDCQDVEIDMLKDDLDDITTALERL